METIQKEITVINKLGLHARASGKLVELASQFNAEIMLGKAEQWADAKNIIALLMLGASQGTVLQLKISGIDAQQAIEEVEALFNQYFGEAG